MKQQTRLNKKHKETSIVYLPRDDNLNLFKVRSSDNALIIFLDYFGYPRIHITLYTKELPKNKMLFDLHITDERNNKKVYETHIEIDFKKTEEEINKRILGIGKEFVKLVKEHQKKKVRNKRLLCLTCYGEEIIKFPEKLEEKTKAKKFYSELLGRTLEININELKKYSKCKNSEHITFIDSKLTNMYMKNKLGTFTFKDQKDFSYELTALLKKEFKKELRYVKKIEKEIKQALKEYKNETTNTK